MHDPCTVAHDIRGLLTVWHVDPEADHTDDSCGWFMRARHCNQDKLNKIAKDFEFQWKSGVPNGWFAENGEPNYSPQAITLGMFFIAANVHFGHWSMRSKRFLNRHMFQIMHFAENSCDSLFTFIVQPYGRDKRDTIESRSRQAACIVYSWICREDRPWYKHPRWHFWHWKLQFHPWQRLKRRWWDKCSYCHKRGFKECAIGTWGGDAIYHSSCYDKAFPQPPNKGVC